MCARQRRQNTLKQMVEFSGVGIHTGAQGKLRVHPAVANSGICFKGKRRTIPALVDNVVSTARSTALGVEEERIQTVEHLMAALSGMHIDNAVIEFEGPEVPILDGSAWPFCREFMRVGLEEQAESVSYLELAAPVFVSAGSSLVLALPSAAPSFEGAVCYPCEEVGYQRYLFASHDDFAEQVAPARTFGFWSEVKQLLDAGLGLGGDLSNALIFGRPADVEWPAAPPDALAQRAGFVTASDVKMRFAQEAVRHKVLDLIGDAALLGRPIDAAFLAVRAGHSLHVDLVRQLRQEAKNRG